MWQRHGPLLEVLHNHNNKPINCLEWNNGGEPMFATGGDDNKIIIWHT